MCTVTYIPTASGFYLTSNRDEQSTRPTISPQKYTLKDQELIYPKDKKAGGSWIAVNNSGRAACLLNGAFEKHHPNGNYSKSRGLILIESFSFPSIKNFSENVSLKNIEPFTMLLIQFSLTSVHEFYELCWDGKNKFTTKISLNTPRIWSSVTLYDQEIINRRKQMFDVWLNKNFATEDKMIDDFHKSKHGLNASEGILMKGDGNLMTLSISQINLKHKQLRFNYHDLIQNRIESQKIKMHDIPKESS